MGKRIIITGMFGCGSSAVWDLLCEYTCNSTGLADGRAYEQNVFYTPAGLFDLCDKLLIGNDLHRSDEAITSFYREMKKLNDNNFGWFGSYRELFGEQFMRLVEDFLSELPTYKIHGNYYGQYKGVRFSAAKVILQLGAKILRHRTIYKWGRQYQFNDSRKEMILSFPDEEEFYQAARRFVCRYTELFGSVTEQNLIYDRLLLPHNLWRVPYFFDDSVRIINVERDVRDLYTLNKYIWPGLHAGAIYPDKVDQFIPFWSHCKKSERRISDPRILTINFEDLIYRYDEWVSRIEAFCGISANAHDNKKKYFNPEKSMVNTQVFQAREEWRKEVEEIERHFPEALYNFNTTNKPDIKKMFDDSRN